MSGAGSGGRSGGQADAQPVSRIDSVLRRVLGADGEADVVSYLKTLYQQVVLGSQIAARHPASDSDLAYHAYTTRQERVEAQSRRLEDMLVALTGQAADLSIAGAGAGAVSREELREMRDDPDVPSTRLSDTVDNLFEGANFDLDEAKGAGSNAQAAVVKGELGGQVTRRARHARPQDKFESKVDNSRAPFVPLIKTKPHATVPLPDYPAMPEGSPYAAYPHPYHEEISTLVYPEAQLRKREPTRPASLADVRLSWVESPQELERMMRALEDDSVTEIAVDLEHHSLHSFQGLTCLIQLSTRDEDFIVDALALRSRLQVLNNVFADPRVVKVLHGCNRDIMWLQRDFGVYLVNVFDTGQAARMLQYPSFGLLHLLQRFCGVTPDKSLQRADWRLRPLSAAMLKYAREDTHYLLYVYDRVVNELLDASTTSDGNLLHEVLRRSAALCLQKYEKPVVGKDSHCKLMEVVGLGSASAKRQAVFAALYDWRDRLARELDESPNVVLHHRPMATLAQRLPTNTQQLVEALNPLPAHVRTRAHEVVEVIVAAKQRTGGERSPDASPPNVRGRPLAASPQGFIPLVSAAPDHKLGAIMSPTPSPVPSADQLCRDAGWLQAANPRGTLRTSLAGTRRRTMFDEAEGRTVRGSSPGDDARGIAIRNRIQASLRQSLVAAQGQAGVAEVASAPLPSPPTLPPPMASGAESLSPMHRSSSTDAAGITIPRSLAEIYQISNRNRTRNKEKKRAQDGSSSGGGGASKKKARGAGAAAGAGGGAGSGSGTGGKKATEDPSTFMQRIGWVEDGADSAAGAGRGGNKRGDGGGAAGAGGGGSRGQGFRYGGAVAAAAGMASGSGGNAAETTSTGGRGSKGGRRGGSGRSGKYSNRGQAAKNNPYVAGYGNSGNGAGNKKRGGGSGGKVYRQRMRHAGERSSASSRRNHS